MGSLSSNIHQMTLQHSVLMVTLLPIPINNHNGYPKWLDEKSQTNQELLNNVRQQVPEPRT
jgi:hypothetical protein